MKTSHYEQMVGLGFKTNFCGDCFIIDYNGTDNVKVMFYDGTIVKCNFGNLKRGVVKNPNFAKIFGVAVNDLPNMTESKAYTIWHSMIRRCYSAVYQKGKPTYIGCTVEPEWLRFSKFLEYFNNLPFSECAETGGYQFDKDILSDGRRGYFKGCVCFVPTEINQVFIKESKAKGYSLLRGRYAPSLRQTKYQEIAKKLELKHMYGTPEEALNAYKLVKEVCVHQLAEKYKGKIADEVYLKLKNYVVVKTVD